MKFGPFSVPKSFDQVWGMVRNLTSGLTSLSFADNFSSFTVTQTIAAGNEAMFPNEFRDNHIPAEWVVVDAQATGTYVLTRGATAWTRANLTLKNHGAADVTATVRFFR